MSFFTKISEKISRLTLMTQLILAIASGSLIVIGVIYFYFIFKQNDLYLHYFNKNTTSITETVKIAIELGASNEQYGALLPVFHWAAQDSSFRFITLLDEKGEEIVTFPPDITIDTRTLLQKSSFSEENHNIAFIGDSLSIVKANWKAKFGSGALLVCFSTNQLTALKSEAITNLSTTMGILFVLSTLLFSSVALRITKPLRKLSEAANTIASGNENFRADESVGGIEIKTVSKAFNSMIDKLTYSQNQRIDEANQYNKSLELQNSKLIELHDEKNEFLGIVAHDLKNPIASIMLNSQIIVNYYDKLGKNEILESIHKIVRTLKSMTNLITDLLDINALESGIVNLNVARGSYSQVVHEVADSFIVMSREKNITIEKHIDEEIYLVADFARMKQVLENLVSNSIKFSPPNTTVTVKCRCRESGKVVFEVQDQGPGIKAEEISKLFGKFSRLSAKPTGNESSSGLGLSIAKKLTESMNGRIWCESSYGNGAKFCLEFPLMTEEV